MPKNNIPENEGKVLNIKGNKVAVFNDHGKLKAFSTTCPHLGCDVEWNGTAKTWDCPCHGSRYTADGKLLNGPAEHGLDPAEKEILDEL